MRVALISAVEEGAGGADHPLAWLPFCGSTIARRQIDLALALGCERIICLTTDTGQRTLPLERSAQSGGAKFQTARGPRQLVGTIQADDELLVFAEGLLIDAAEAVPLLQEGNGILTLPADIGIPAGFERIDADYAWAGVFIIPGGLVDQLDELPSDVDPVSTLLRMALQFHVPRRAVPPEALADGWWQLLTRDTDIQALEAAWLRRRLPEASIFSPTNWLSRQILDRHGAAMLAHRDGAAAAVSGGILLLAAALACAWFAFPIAGFVLLAPAAVVLSVGSGVLAMRQPPRAIRTWTERATPEMIPLLRDLTILGVAALAIDGTWYERLFPPGMMIGLLWMDSAGGAAGWRALLNDRALLTLAMAIAACFGIAEPAIMAWAAALLVLQAIFGNRGRG